MTDQDRAFGYVHGALTPGERACVTRERLYNKNLDVAITALERTQGAVDADLDEATTAPDIWSRLHDTVRLQNEALPATSISEFIDGEWVAQDAGVEFKQLWNDGTVILRCEPGACQDSHEQPSDQVEHILVIAGDLLIGARELGTGDHLVIPAGSSHPRMSTQGGCILFQQYI